MPNFPAWLALTFLAGEALVVIGPLLLVAAVLILAVPSLRQRRGLRRTAHGLLIACSILLICALPAGLTLMQLRPRQSTTYHLSAPRSFSGVLFPAGSTVNVWPDDDRIEFGNVPSPTVIEGMPLIGGFRFPTAAESAFTGTLAVPFTLNGIPCAPGPVKVYTRELGRCVLARHYDFEGHLLAEGQDIEIYRPSGPLPPGTAYFPPELKMGVLAKPELLFDILWPAGTVVGGLTESPERMAHTSQGEAVFCLPAGKSAEIPGATLHGFIAYYKRDDYLRVMPKCELLPEHGYDMDGYAQVGPSRFHLGYRETASPWTWSTDAHW